MGDTTVLRSPDSQAPSVTRMLRNLRQAQGYLDTLLQDIDDGLYIRKEPVYSPHVASDFSDLLVGKRDVDSAVSGGDDGGDVVK